MSVLVELVMLCSSKLAKFLEIFTLNESVFCESIPGRSDSVFRLPSIVQISAGSSISILEIRKSTFVVSLNSQFNLYRNVSSSFFEVSDLFR